MNDPVSDCIVYLLWIFYETDVFCDTMINKMKKV